MILRIAAIVPFVASFLVVLLTDGGVYPGSLSIAVALMALSLAIASTTARLQAQTLPIFVGALAIWLSLSVWTLVQIWPLPGGVLANGAWAYLQPQGIEASAMISVTPGEGLYSLLPLSLAFMTLLSALLLFRSDREAEAALKAFAVSGACLALFAIVQFKLFPGTLMFSAKLDYLSSLTAPFVNRNTAATFYGVVLIALIASLTVEIAKARSVRSGLVARSAGPRWFFAAMVFIVLLALALTTSRGGILAAIVAAGGLSVALFFWLRKGRARSPLAMRRADTGRTRAAAAGLVAFGLAAAAVFLFGRTLFRVNMLGSEDGRLCVYPGVARAIEQNWIAGAGAGAFEAVFPAYMDPACGTINAWVRAHNVYLDMALAYGVPVTVVLLLCAFGAVLHILAKGMKHRKSKKPFVLAGCALFILVIFHSAVDFSVQIPGFAMSCMLVSATVINFSVNNHAKR